MRKPIAISVAVAMVAIAIPAAALAFGVPRPPSGRYKILGEPGWPHREQEGERGQQHPLQDRNRARNRQLLGNQPDLGKVAITAKGSYPITLGRENGYQVWIVGKVDKTAYHRVAEIPAKFKIKARQQDR